MSRTDPVTGFTITTYRQLLHHDVWHWIPSCSNYPKRPKKFREIESDGGRPSDGELCNECRSKERKLATKKASGS